MRRGTDLELGIVFAPQGNEAVALPLQDPSKQNDGLVKLVLVFNPGVGAGVSRDVDQAMHQAQARLVALFGQLDEGIQGVIKAGTSRVNDFLKSLLKVWL